MKTLRALGSCVTLAILVSAAAQRPASSREPAVSRTLPVTVHLLHFQGLPILTTQVSDREARRVVAAANRIWSAAGLSIVVDAVRQDEAIHDPAALGWLASSHDDEGPDAVLANLARIRPPIDRDRARVHIYFIGTLPCNGITMLPDAVFVQDEPRLVQVAGGGHDARARVLAHELGHVFGLFHAPERDRLMFGGSNGVRVTDRDVATFVHSLSGVGTPP